MSLNLFFEQVLQLAPPYSISIVEESLLENGGKSINIHIDISPDYLPDCVEGETCTRHDIEPRQWRHLDLFEYPCYIHCNVPKYKYHNAAIKHSYVRTLVVPWSRSGSGFTLQFEQTVLGLVQLYGCVARVATQVKEYPQRIQTLLNFYEPQEPVDLDNLVSTIAEEPLSPLATIMELAGDKIGQSDELSTVTKLKIDETSRKKGHDYITNFLDGNTGKLLDIQPGKGAKTIERFVAKGLLKGFDPSKITDVSIDLSPAFICGVDFYFPQANISFDKFHVSQLVNRCFDSFRKSQSGKFGKRLPKWELVKPIEKLNAREHKKMNDVLAQLPELEQFHEHKNKFSDLWKYEKDEAAQGAAYLSFWIDHVEQMGKDFKSSKIKTLANTLNTHFKGIANVLKSGMDNAASEGFNTKVQTMKRVARGYKKFETYIQMIKLHCDTAT